MAHPGLSLFSLLATRVQPWTSSSSNSLTSPADSSSSVPEWTSFASESQRFLSSIYVQSDSPTSFTDPRGQLQQNGCENRASAAAYVSLLELSNEYVRRFGLSSSRKLHITFHQDILVLYESCKAEHPDAASAVKGHLILRPKESWTNAREAFDAVVGLLPDLRDGAPAYACVTNFDRSYFFNLTTGNAQVSDAARTSLFEALFLLVHLVHQQKASCRNPKRKLSMISEAADDQFTAESLNQLIKPCRMLGFSFGSIAELMSQRRLDVTLTRCISDFEDYSVHKGNLEGENVLVKLYPLSSHQEMLQEVRVLLKLESLQVEVVPRLYTFGVGGRGMSWYIVMEDVSSAAAGEGSDHGAKKGHLEAARSSLSALHRANVAHNRVHVQNLVVGEGGKVFWINLESATIYEDLDEDDADEFWLLARADVSKLVSSKFFSNI